MAVCLSGSRAGMLSMLVVVGCVGYPHFRSFRMYQKTGIVLMLVISMGVAYFMKKSQSKKQKITE